MVQLRANNIESLVEWEKILEHLVVLERDYMNHALDAKTIEELCELRGRIAMIREMRNLPEKLFGSD